MRALVWEAPRVMALREQPVPEPAADEVLLKVAYAGICGSELSGYLGTNALRVPPLVMGHEFSGTVAALGASVTGLRPDQPVTVNPLIVCGTCGFCKQGQTHLCPQRTLIGAARPGAYAEYVLVPARQAIALPPGLTLASAALAEPLAVAVHAVALAGDVTDAEAMVVGAGPIGLLILQMLRERGAARVWIADRDAGRLTMAAELGGTPVDARTADIVHVAREATSGRGVALAFDAVGTARTRAQCVAGTISGGTVILSGLHEEVGMMPAAEIIRREIIVRGSFCYTAADFAAAVALLARGDVRLAPWITEDTLESGGAWFDRLLANDAPAAKILLVP